MKESFRVEIIKEGLIKSLIFTEDVNKKGWLWLEYSESKFSNFIISSSTPFINPLNSCFTFNEKDAGKIARLLSDKSKGIFLITPDEVGLEICRPQITAPENYCSSHRVWIGCADDLVLDYSFSCLYPMKSGKFTIFNPDLNMYVQNNTDIHVIKWIEFIKSCGIPYDMSGIFYTFTWVIAQKTAEILHNKFNGTFRRA